MQAVYNFSEYGFGLVVFQFEEIVVTKCLVLRAYFVKGFYRSSNDCFESWNNSYPKRIEGSHYT